MELPIRRKPAKPRGDSGEELWNKRVHPLSETSNTNPRRPWVDDQPAESLNRTYPPKWFDLKPG